MGFLKILARNLRLGPSTDPYPFGETFVPENLRGKVSYDAKACVACRMCVHVCAGGAIRIEESADKKGLDFTLWHNTCAFCGLCAYYCPTGAIKLTPDFHTAHVQAEKYTFTETGFVGYVPCRRCGRPMVPVAKKLLEQGYGDLTGEVENLSSLCEECRRELSAESGVKQRWMEERRK